jgi:hypothetical protein
LSKSRIGKFPRKDWGSTLTILAFSMLALTAMVGVAIDLVAFYTVRSEAQRAADAAALAGATVFVTSGCTGGSSGVTGSCTNAAVKTAAAAQATAIGNNNLVGGASPAISGTVNGSCPPTAGNDVCFTADAAGTNPRISVLVQRTTAHGNAMPTFFAKILGIQSVDVSAQASAEAFNPTGGSSTSASICLSCVVPFIAVDCDTSRTVPKGNANANPVCTVNGTTNNPYIVNPTTKALVNPGISPGGIIGETLILHGNVGPADYGTTDMGQGNGASATHDAITTCFAGNWGCGDTIELVPGKKTNQIADGVTDRIHSSQCVAASSTSPQDNITVNASNTPPITITGGTANPYGLAGKTITSSDSIVTVPVYDGTSTGNGSHTTFTIIGFLQLFLTEACHNGSSDDVTAVVMNVITCQNTAGGCNGSGTSGNPGGGFVAGGGAKTIPVRLVQ